VRGRGGHPPTGWERRTTPWSQNWWRRRATGWASPHSGTPSRRQPTTSSRRTCQRRMTRSPSAGTTPQLGPCGRNPPSGMEEVVAKAARVGCHMLIIDREWPGPHYSWWISLCVLCPNRCCLPQYRSIYIRWVSDLMPAPKCRTWAFLLESRSGSQAQQSLPPPPPVGGPTRWRHPGAGTRAPSS